MNNYSNVEEKFIELSEKKLDVLKILAKYLSYWKLFAISIILFLTVALLYLYFAIPQYQLRTSILFRDDERGGMAEMSLFQEMGGYSRRNNVNNEIVMMKKSMIAEDVVRAHNLNVSYIKIAPIFAGLSKIFDNPPMYKTEVLWGNQLPAKISLPEERLDMLGGGVTFMLHAYPNGECLFTGDFRGDSYSLKASLTDSVVVLPFGEIFLTEGRSNLNEKIIIEVTVMRPLSAADEFINSMEIELASNTSSVAEIKLSAPNIELGRFFLREYINAYNEKGIEDQLELAERTSNIIDNHLSKLSNDLSNVEDQAQSFRQSQGLTDIGSQADIYNTQMASMGQRRMDIESQYNIVVSLLSYVQQLSGHNQLIPANSGVQSPILNAQITEYNDLVLERNRLSRIASSSNQSMIDLNNILASTYNSVVSGLQSERNNLDILLKDINTEYSRNYARIRAIPQQERVFSDIMREQNTKEALFLYLLQRKEERYMNMTVVAPNSKFVDNIRTGGVVFPNKKITLLIYLFLGLALPLAIIKIKELLTIKINSREEFEEITSIPILGEIPKEQNVEAVSVRFNRNDGFNEMLRLVRANLLFVIDGKKDKVINILSSISGEGKSFVSVNLAMTLALLDKKVLLIELDIRKPELTKKFELNNTEGITLYLSGYSEKQDLVKPSGIHDNLFFINAGAIPPNPNELLAKPLLDDLINELRDDYDFIIIDTAPIGMVSDGFLLDRVADVNLYIARIGYTPKKYITEAEGYFYENRLKKMYFILNSVDLNSTEYRYAYGKNHQYGYRKEMRVEMK